VMEEVRPGVWSCPLGCFEGRDSFSRLFCVVQNTCFLPLMTNLSMILLRNSLLSSCQYP
jgi:hypothetical protein